MFSNLKAQLLALGLLRQGLMIMALSTMLLPALQWTVTQVLAAPDKHSLLAISAGLIAPTMAPILIVVILVDFVMAKVRVADDPVGAGPQYKFIIRIEVILMLAMLAFWIPFFMSMTP